MREGFCDMSLKISTLESSSMATRTDISAIHDTVNAVVAKVEELRLDPVQQYTRLQGLFMSKPSLLQEACHQTRGSSIADYKQTEENEEHHNILTLKKTPKRPLLCKCQFPQLYQCNDHRLWLRSVFFSWTSIRSHGQHCAFYQHEQQLSIWLYTTYLLHGAVRASICIKQGAGGAAISPSLIYHPMVSNDSPAFAALSTEHFRADFEPAMIRIRQLFERGEASPYDTDEWGNTLLLKAMRRTPYYCYSPIA
ncbi:hypothetical protein EV356DRAFT_320426 [Viridothelium virens]|uniref:Uncharacterized protein n=1 Tax=Viridothelium virens TaxID=1048519 RepID=A0A6A6GYM1_VIRVR|nr:hypothetical protein EV356DRAFT_320426 [Viridothelium virens]